MKIFTCPHNVRLEKSGDCCHCVPHEDCSLKKKPVILNHPLPGQAVDEHLKTFGHLPTSDLCDRKGSCQNNKEWDVELAEDGTIMAEFQKERTDALTEMLDNEYANGIYPTSKFYARLDKAAEKLLQKNANVNEPHI